MGFFKKIIDGLKKTQQNIGFQIKKLFKVGIFNDDFYENLEEILLTSDVGAQATEEIVDNLKEKIRQTKTVDEENATRLLKEALSDVLGDEQFQTDYPCVILVVGVNGVGKTTTIGKLARNFVREGKSVVLAAADTFRAAAGEQLEIWAKRADVRIIKHEEGSDPAAVVFDALSSAKILADEPVASLDPVTAKQVMDDFQRINRDMRITILINIHHVDLALQYATRVIGIRAGRVVYDGPAGEVDGAVLDAIYQDRKEATA